MRIKNLIKDGLVIWFGSISLVVFAFIVVHGTYYFFEPTPWILILELAFSVVVLIFGFYWLIRDITGGIK